LLKMIVFDRANRPVTTGPIRRRPEGPSLPERIMQELQSVADLWKKVRVVRLSHRAQMGAYFLLIEDELGIRPPHGFIVSGDGSSSGLRMTGSSMQLRPSCSANAAIRISDPFLRRYSIESAMLPPK